jgi:hypothetical protein
MSPLTHRLSIPAMILTALATWLTPQASEAQVRTRVPYYQVQVLYSIDFYGGYDYGHYDYPSYAWLTIVETDDYEEAEFVYALYLLAQEQGVLDEVAPNYDYDHGHYYGGADYTAIDVQMLTKYRYRLAYPYDQGLPPLTTSPGFFPY